MSNQSKQSGDYILVTGGAGYIGSHTVLELLNLGRNVVVVDDLSNSSEEALRRVEKLTQKKVTFHKFDICDAQKLSKLFETYKISSVIHFAGYKAVGESVHKPLKYYQNNLLSTLVLIKQMELHGVKNLIFSSSATVYGKPEKIPIDESAKTGSTSPYGRTKWFIEHILRDYCVANKNFNAVLLRYFNPVGAHSSGLIGEDPNGIPNNLMPYVSQVAVGKLPFVRVFGSDYNTPDGTGVRDYLHVVDLANGHVAALDKCQASSTAIGCVEYNLGTGKGYSVLEMVKSMGKAAGKEIPYKLVERRAGDVAEVIADPSKAKNELGWVAKLGLDDMCKDMWKWQSMNPNGFKSGSKL
jgi:UDP-glucose 4-epimerase